MNNNARKIILIAIDTLRADHLGCYGHKQPTSPNIDEIARQGILFENHYATDVPTRPSFTALFTGQRGLKNGIVGHEDKSSNFKNALPLLAERFAEAGYRTGMISNLLYTGPWLAKGFKDIIPPGLRWQGGDAEEVTREASQWLKLHSSNDFFLFIHYWDPHGPYTRAPKSYQQMFSSNQYTALAPNMKFINNNKVLKAYYTEYHKIHTFGETRPEKILAYYDSEIRYTNDCINQIFQLLQKLNIDEDTLLVITSDHGEAFGEYGFLGHPSCYRNVAHIPLIFWWPRRISENQRVKSFSSGVDVMPTLLEYSGLPVPENICGKSLVNLLEGKVDKHREEIVTNTTAAVIQRMFIQGDWALVHTLSGVGFDHIKKYELFNLVEDKFQEVDVSEKESETFGRMRLSLEDWLAEELNDEPDLLHLKIAQHGGWAWRNRPFREILTTRPQILLENPKLKKIFIKRFGPAVNWLKPAS